MREVRGYLASTPRRHPSKKRNLVRTATTKHAKEHLPQEENFKGAANCKGKPKAKSVRASKKGRETETSDDSSSLSSDEGSVHRVATFPGMYYRMKLLRSLSSGTRNRSWPGNKQSTKMLHILSGGCEKI